MANRTNHRRKIPRKLVAFRVEEELLEIAGQSRIVRATQRLMRPESFSAYLRNLIMEEWERNLEVVDRAIPKMPKKTA